MSSDGDHTSPGGSISRDTDTNATPEPPGWKCHPVSPSVLSSKLGFIEAAASLSHATEVLSTAAKAMSSAAQSLTMISSRLGYEDDFVPTRFSLTGVDVYNWMSEGYNFFRLRCRLQNYHPPYM